MKNIKLFIITAFTFFASICHGNMLDHSEGEVFKDELIRFLNASEKSDPAFSAHVQKSLQTLQVGYDEAIVMQDIWQLLAHDPSLLQKILEGAHVRILDNGFMYFKWEELKTARARISSHPSIPTSVQYGIVGPISHEILFGIVEVQGDIFTFFQLENTPWDRSLSNMVWHTMDAMQYLITGKNIGPYGMSEHTDKNPLMF